MWKLICGMLFITSGCNAGPVVNQVRFGICFSFRFADNFRCVSAPLTGTLTLPSNATSIRADITDNFSCANKSYGYYADVENDCQIFHVCLPVTYADGKENTFRWSFICPEETIFSQESFTCMRREDMGIECEDSYRYYELNANFGLPVEEQEQEQQKQPAAVMESESMDQDSEASAPAEQAVEPAEPVAVAPAAAVAPPVKVQKPKPKPNRRKPALSYNKPPRKAAAAIAAPAPIETTVEVASNPMKPVKPTMKPQRFSSRPSQAKPQETLKTPVNPATPQRNELFNSIRKRPAIFNKKPNQESEQGVTEAIVQAELSEPQPTLKLQTMFVNPTLVKVEQEPEAQASDVAETIAELEKEQPEEVIKKVEEMKPLEAMPEIPAVILETLEEKPQEIEQVEQVENSQSAVMESEPEPAIIEPGNSSNEEQSASNIEALEAAKPADAPVSLPSTPEMTQTNPLVEQMLDSSSSSSNSNEVPESLGGFKPVDPHMAAEAEQLITDFLNTLRNHEQQPEKKLQTEMDMAEVQQEQQQQQQSIPNETEADAVSIEEAKLPEPEIVDKDASVEEQVLKTEAKLKLTQDSQDAQDSPIIQIMQLNHLPADYQIPVQVLSQETKPMEESPKQDDDAGQEHQEESLATAAYMPPISIDDIVELVKERLDQNPKGEQLTPMELVLTPGAAAPMALIESNKDIKQEAEQESEQEKMPESEAELDVKPAAVAAEEPEQEELILPIYKRVQAAEPAKEEMDAAPAVPAAIATAAQAAQAAPSADLALSADLAISSPSAPAVNPVAPSALAAPSDPSSSAAPSAPSSASSPSAPSTAPSSPPAASLPELRQSKSHSSMDARKRRFLFRADAS
ncbi:uncharacterized protein KIAA0754 [Drosophila grimshawi]|uniref:uncharacterized protein KIAA0754 n=1 Tax=Drosophila grimshawi TaxID=7222 RepID=UPI001C93410C|nr:uncharacterized protein KIAA0754 [Drosophila grimshawi]